MGIRVFASALVAVIWLSTACSDSNNLTSVTPTVASPTATGSGGHEPPSPEALAVIDALPPYPGSHRAAVVSRGNASGKIGTESISYVYGTPDDLIVTYAKTLQGIGWRMESPLKLNKTGGILDGTSHATAEAILVKGAWRLTLFSIGYSEEPTKGNAKLNVFAAPLD